MLRPAATLVALVSLTACGADERAARRADALDLAGFWVEVDGPRPPMRLQITNQDGVNDVVVAVDRADDDDLDDGERALIARLQNANDQLVVRSALTIGVENDAARDEVDGGDNVSFDGGATSTLRVMTSPYPARPTDDDATSVLRWGLALDGDDTALAGNFFITDLQQRHIGDGDSVETSVERFNLPVAFARE